MKSIFVKVFFFIDKVYTIYFDHLFLVDDYLHILTKMSRESLSECQSFDRKISTSVSVCVCVCFDTVHFKNQQKRKKNDTLTRKSSSTKQKRERKEKTLFSKMKSIADKQHISIIIQRIRTHTKWFFPFFKKNNKKEKTDIFSFVLSN